MSAERQTQDLKKSPFTTERVRNDRRNKTLSLRSSDRLSRCNQKRKLGPPVLSGFSSFSPFSDPLDDSVSPHPSSSNSSSSSTLNSDNECNSDQDDDRDYDDGRDFEASAPLPSPEELGRRLDVLLSPSSPSSQRIEQLRFFEHFLGPSGSPFAIEHLAKHLGRPFLQALFSHLGVSHGAHPRGFPDAVDLQLLSAHCIANLAVGNSEQTRPLLNAVPLLAAVLKSSIPAGGGPEELLASLSSTTHERSRIRLLVACTHAISNLASDGPEFVEAILDCGLLQTLLVLFRACCRALRAAESETCALLATLASALGPIVGSPTHVASLGPEDGLGLLRQCEGALGLLCEGQAHFDGNYEPLVAELLWLITYVSSALNCQTANVVLEVDEKRLLVLFGRLQVADLSHEARVPLLRSLGNLFNLCDDLVFRKAFATLHGLCLGCLLPAMKSRHRAVVKEACWFLRCLVARALHTEQFQLLVDSQELVSTALPIFANFAIDIKQELAIFVLELFRRKTMVRDILPQCLKPFLSLLRHPNPDVAVIALQFTEMVLSQSKSAPRQVDRAGGIDDLEYLELHSPVPGLSDYVHRLVDRYFGMDYEV